MQVTVLLIDGMIFAGLRPATLGDALRSLLPRRGTLTRKAQISKEFTFSFVQKSQFIPQICNAQATRAYTPSYLESLLQKSIAFSLIFAKEV
ncbi:hypothetical protein [Nostoc favosum]|uniref:Uncharacterized protein n=1 Tax=Nostoc favosum CHAB5714 TaxID=2780399 RepID=A0ABS8I4Q9_9NOSO|nr:hypothetical protein [Nostoc favosum]MCC5599141.1 hypothetical protein [Nostoc favosum CHAB5714]